MQVSNEQRYNKSTTMSLSSKVYTAPFCWTASFQKSEEQKRIQFLDLNFESDPKIHTTETMNNKLVIKQNEWTKEGGKEERNVWTRDRRTAGEDVQSNQ